MFGGATPMMAALAVMFANLAMANAESESYYPDHTAPTGTLASPTPLITPETTVESHSGELHSSSCA